MKDKLQPVFNKIDELLKNQSHVVISLDGRSGSGKSTIAGEIAKRYQARVINCDDFYAGDESDWKTMSPADKIKTVIDYQRIENEVLKPLLENKIAIYHPFDFQAGKGLAKQQIKLNPSPLIVIDGVYSSLNLKFYLDISILVNFPDSERRQRLINREGEKFMQDWHSKWDNAEDYYFDEVVPKLKFDLKIEGQLY